MLLGREVGRPDGVGRGEAALGSGSSGEDDSDAPPARKPYRSRSLPHLLTFRDSGVGYSGSCSGAEPEIKVSNCQKFVYDIRQLLTLKQHYYPEGGWGWVVVVCGCLVQCISFGLQGASGVLVPEILKRFEGATEYEAGELAFEYLNNNGVCYSKNAALFNKICFRLIKMS